MKNKIYICTLLFVFLTPFIKAQTNNPDSLLKSHLKDVPALNEKVSISVSNTSIQEFMRGVANSSGLNIDVDPTMDIKIVNNFSDVRVLDMLVFLAEEYQLNIDVIGNIVTVSKDPVETLPQVRVGYIENKNLLTLDVKDEELFVVAKYITAQTGKNIMPRTNARSERIRCYIKEMPFEAAIEEMALANGLKMTLSDDGFFIIEKEQEQIASNTQTVNQASRTRNSRTQTNQRRSASQSEDEYVIEIEKLRTDSLLIEVENAPIEAILQELNDREPFNYFISPGLTDMVTGKVVGKDLDLLLSYLFSGTNVAHKRVNDVFIIGEKKLIDYNEHKVVQLQNRSIDKILEYVPSDLSENIEVIEFPELNSLFLTGPAYQIDEFELFVKEIDKVVPVVLIEVILMYVNKSIGVSTGIQAGLGDAPVQTSGQVFPSVDMTIGADKINQIINGSGWVNLGNVSPNFYLVLQAMETQGFIELTSTPKLSTLNGHEASLSIGETEYYLEESTQLYGTQNPQQTTTREYKPVNAELSIKIKPFVSGDEHITLEIEVKQSDFTERISKEAPPGSVNRDFVSEIRVKNNEMILLGGLMEQRKSEAGTGMPILSRIPVIKWLFSSRQSEDSDEKLSLLIRPIIIN
jgi:type IV pilus assembly protein PilQ